jgi:hypothetical protein
MIPFPPFPPVMWTVLIGSAVLGWLVVILRLAGILEEF